MFRDARATVAGCRNYFAIGAEAAQCNDDFDTLHIRHDNIGDDEVGALLTGRCH